MDFLKLDNGIIIDLRKEGVYHQRHLPKAINIPFNQLIVYHAKYLTQNKNYLLVCDYGKQSYQTSRILNRLGYKTYSLKSGMQSFKNL